MRIKQFIGSITAVLLMLLPLLNSCENIDTHNNDKQDFAEHLRLNRLNDVLSIVETAIEVCELTNGNGMPADWKDLKLGRIKSVLPKDSIFYDGNEIRFELDFGNIEEAAAGGVLPDGKVRFGVMKVQINKFFKEIGSVAQIKFETPFGLHDDDDFSFEGEIYLTRISQSKIKVGLNALSLEDDMKKELEFDGELVYDCITPAFLNRAWGNEYQLLGGFDMLQFDNNLLQNTMNVTLLSPVLRKLESGCSNTPSAGIMDCKFENEILNSRIDFDPFDNQACDNFVRITQKDRVFDFIVD